MLFIVQDSENRPDRNAFPAFGTFILERERGNVFIKKMILEVGKCFQENKTGNMIKGVGGGWYE